MKIKKIESYKKIVEYIIITKNEFSFSKMILQIITGYIKVPKELPYSNKSKQGNI